MTRIIFDTFISACYRAVLGGGGSVEITAVMN